MFYVYILKCSDDSYYTGHTDDLEKRISEHKNKTSEYSYTSTRLPIELVYAQAFEERHQAWEAEWQIKYWTRRKKEALIAKNWDRLIALSKKIFSSSHTKE